MERVEVFTDEDTKEKIYKKLLRKGDGKEINFTKGSKALFHYKTFVFKEPEQEHAHGDAPCTTTHPLSNKINKILIADSRIDTDPFELR